MRIEDVRTKVRAYTIHEQISEGAFGSVFKATNRFTSRLCAIKVIDVESHPIKTLSFILNEGSLLINLKHPNIIRLFDERQFENYRVFEFELLQKTLLDLINDRCKNGTGFSEQEIQTIVQGLLSGIEYLHNNDVVHRDLKPENIGFVHANDLKSLKIIDFGLSTRVSSRNFRMINSVVGTINYMAPEIFYMDEYNGVD